MNDNMQENILNNLSFTEMSSSFLLGLSVGFFFKKGFKIFLFVAGLVTVGIFWFNSQNIINVDDNNILSIFDILSATLKSTYSFVYSHISNLKPVAGASVVAGFIAGLKFG